MGGGGARVCFPKNSIPNPVFAFTFFFFGRDFLCSFSSSCCSWKMLFMIRPGNRNKLLQSGRNWIKLSRNCPLNPGQICDAMCSDFPNQKSSGVRRERRVPLFSWFICSHSIQTFWRTGKSYDSGHTRPLDFRLPPRNLLMFPWWTLTDLSSLLTGRKDRHVTWRTWRQNCSKMCLRCDLLLFAVILLPEFRNACSIMILSPFSLWFFFRFFVSFSARMLEKQYVLCFRVWCEVTVK